MKSENTYFTKCSVEAFENSDIHFSDSVVFTLNILLVDLYFQIPGNGHSKAAVTSPTNVGRQKSVMCSES